MNLFLPNVAYAQNGDRFNDFLANVNSLIINPLIGLLFALAVVFFLYGVFEFIKDAENEESRTTGKNHMIWGIVGITVMLGVWGILNIVLNTLDIRGINPEENTVNLPEYNPNPPRVNPNR
jgi:succinate dehydrogenase/fumarate reductase cytochrome b subunit